MYKVLSVAGNDSCKFEEELNRLVDEKWVVSSELQVTFDPVTEKFLFSLLLKK